ncbi:MAG: SAM-dependent methyltransferase [Chloroflexi bacterium]|nr:MAG: SAM-dependent methyltransferase [Chloroflexota bacterium]
MDWTQWHEMYSEADSPLSRRLVAVRRRIAEALDHFPAGPIRLASMCAGDGRDILGVLQNHPRAGDVSGRLVELDGQLAEQARAAAPAAIEVHCGDAGSSDAYAGAVPVDLLLCCGVFGNITEEDIRNTIESWPMLCAPEATVLWTRGAFEHDIRPQIRQWVKLAGFEELAFDGMDDRYGVGVAKMVRAGKPYRRGIHFFSFTPERQGK